MKIIVAPDSFKECLSAPEVCRAMARGIKSADRGALVVSAPMADGGEGTLSALTRASDTRVATVRGPLGKPVKARFGIVNGGKTAVIEMAQASGLHLVPPAMRNPMRTSSFGTGQLIARALDAGCKEIILTLGGVATNDAGVGMARALGYRFLDASGEEVPGGAGGLLRLNRIDARTVHPRLRRARFTACCDVRNPLCGPRGSAEVYGPQKGATPAMVRDIDRALRLLAGVIRRDTRKNVLNLPGAGAAGGAGAGAAAFLNARLAPGAQAVMETMRLEEKMRGADLVITGEGRLDGQTAFGKTVLGVAGLARKRGIPCIALCGALGPGHEKARAFGLDAAFSIAPGPIDREESMRRARNLIAQASENIVRLWKTR